MSNLAGDIDEIIGDKAYKNVELAIEKMGVLYVSFKQNVTAINLMNDALNKATSIKDVSTNIEKISKKTKQLQGQQTEFIDTQRNVDKAFRESGDVLNQLEKDYANVTNKATAMTVNNKKIIADNTALKASIQTVDQQWKLLEADYKRLTLEARNMGAAHGVMSTQFKTSAANANIVRKEMDAINNTLGHSQANVGNYASGLNKVWGGLRQLAYIIPGLGIAGIFNIALEAITPLVMKIGIFNNEMKNFKTVMAEGMKASTQEVETLDRLYKKTQDVTVSVEARKNAVDKLQELYPHYFKNINDEVFLNGGAKKSYDELRTSIIEMAKAKAVESKITEIINDGIEQELKLTENLKKAKALAALNKGKLESDIVGFDIKDVGQADRLRQAKVNDAEVELAVFKDSQNKKLKLYREYLNSTKNIESEVLRKPEPGSTGDKEVNRINDIKAQYEEEVSLLKTKLNKEQITEEQFYSQMIDLSRKYYATRAGLTEKEKQTEIKFNETLSQSEKENHDAIIKWLEQEVLAAGEADDKRLKASLKRIEEIRKANERAYQEELDYIKGQMDAQERMFAEDERLEQERFTQKMKYLGKTNEVVQSATSALSSIGDIMYMRDMERINSKNQALKDYYDNELRAIEESGLSQAQQAKEKKKLDAETAAQQKQIDRDRISAMRKQAGIQKGIDIASLIGSTTVAVMSALSAKPYSPLNIALAAGAAAKGAGELARLIATPLPQYAKGRKGGPAEWAIVSEVGQEAKVSKSGEMSLLPATKSKVFLNEGDSVIPHHDLLKHASYLKLAYSSANKTDNSTEALLQAHTEEIRELKGLRVDLRNKELSSNYHNLSGYNNYKEANRM